MIFEILIIAVILVVTLFVYSSSLKSKYPPGPWSVPILGHLPLLGDQPARTLLKWKKIYGPIISVRFGSFPAVVINDTSLIKTAFNLPAFSGRPHMKLFDDYSRGRKGFIFTDGPDAQEQREFIQKNLKDFGYGSRTMESIVLDQINELLQKFEQNGSKALSVKRLFSGYIINSLWSIVTGKQIKPGDEETTQLAETVTRFLTLPRIVDKLMIFIPRLAIWFPNWSGFNDKMKCSDDVEGFIQKQINHAKTSRVRNQPRMVLDAYLDKVDDTTDPQSSFHEKRNCLTKSLQDLFGAGIETSSTILEWMLYYLAKYPEVQKKFQNEIDNMIGISRLPSGNDRSKMPYAEAVINEVLRISTLVPLSMFHNTLEDVEFQGYKIPKNTMIVSNLHAAHHDPLVWGDPEEFRPERFLDDEGNILKSANFMPFSWGKRNCIGENLARMQLFLFAASMYQQFEIYPEDTLPPAEGDFGITVAPFPFNVIIKKRLTI